ncbi:peptidoglycan DD-metalloendopeptidase family protein, partial [Burkholderia gladioli]|nr:peptidoglycan DD-metalloendopeptidase family protein [Burkholderia gladioli]
VLSPVEVIVMPRVLPGMKREVTVPCAGQASAGGSAAVVPGSAAAGRVVYAGTGVAKYGPLVILKHESGLITAYGHNGKLLVNDGDAVAAGQAIAEMATDPDGRSSFDFEVRQDGKPVDPIGFLPRNGG